MGARHRHAADLLGRALADPDMTVTVTVTEPVKGSSGLSG